jgi:hypothetical protein
MISRVKHRDLHGAARSSGSAPASLAVRHPTSLARPRRASPCATGKSRAPPRRASRSAPGDPRRARRPQRPSRSAPGDPAPGPAQASLARPRRPSPAPGDPQRRPRARLPATPPRDPSRTLALDGARRPAALNRSITRAAATAPTLCAVSTALQPPRWPADPGHRDAIDTLLVMAEAENRWGESRRAIDLLDNVEQIVGTLPQPYERMRGRWRSTSSRPRRR